jgi:hypothetical protein
MIGIKIADGTFFPILEENKVAKKRLVLTTAHDSQTNVQIDVYKSRSMSMDDASYIGTLLVENITKKEKGNPSIEFVIAYNDNSELLATAYDIEQPSEKNKALLVVLMQPEDDGPTPEDFLFEIEPVQDEKFGANVKRSGAGQLTIAASAVIIIIFALFALWFFIFRTKSPQVDPPTRSLTEAQPVETKPEPVVTPASPPVASSPLPDTDVSLIPASPLVTANPSTDTAVSQIPAPPVVTPPAHAPPQMPILHPDAPVYSAKRPDVIPAGGVRYRLRWGDTLWDVSQAFYGTPWRYRYIARYNGLRNPNRVVSGVTITIPPPPR